jgi:hypothetical protein
LLFNAKSAILQLYHDNATFIKATMRNVLLNKLKSQSLAVTIIVGNPCRGGSSGGRTVRPLKLEKNILIFKEYSFLQTQYLYSDGGLSDTGILVDLQNKNDSTVR